MPRPNRRERGFTLTEIIIATAIFTVILVAALMIYDGSNRVFKQSVESAEMQQESRIGFERLVRDVRMAGFDYDRDGTPMLAGTTVWEANTSYQQGRIVIPITPNGFSYIATNGGTSGANVTWPTTAGATVNDNGIVWRAQAAQYQQPDEQIEFAGLSAITIRANLDYHTDATNEHGRERDHEPTGGQFPIVTTANNEIVTYALRSDKVGAPNSDTISFWADVSVPRRAYPGGGPETEIRITGVDLCDDDVNGTPGCIHPPYTLYRYTLRADGTHDGGTAVARNIRSLKFFYYSKPSGREADLITFPRPATGTPTVPTQGAIGGDGQFDPANGNTTNVAYRAQRAEIQSVRIELVGMNSAADPRYSNPTESLAAYKQYRTFPLSTLVVPRNAGLSGMQEPTSDRPTPPNVKSVCAGYCRATRVIWDAPLSGNVSSYEVRFDTSPSGSFGGVAATVPGDQLVSYVNLPALPSGATQYYVKVRAINEHGITDSTNYLTTVPINKTRPLAPASLLATGTATTSEQPNQITLSWPRVVQNDPAFATLSCSGAGASTDGRAIPPQELIRYRVWRGTTADFDPTAGEGTLILSEATDDALQPSVFPTTTTVTFVDGASSPGGPPANCKPYFYRIQAYDDPCVETAAANDPANVGTAASDIFPALNVPAIEGGAQYPSATTPVPPSPPASVTINTDLSRCRVGLNRCEIKLEWPKVTTDTAGNTITIDRYQILRERRRASDTTWTTVDLSPAPLPDVEGVSLQPGPTATYTDTTAQNHEPSTREKYIWRYSVRAEYCTTNGNYSAPVIYPQSCSVGSSVQASGAYTGSGTQADPWPMAQGDYIQVIPGSGATIDRVDFELLSSTHTPVTSASDDLSPYILPWENLTDGEVYMLIVTVTQVSGCVEQLIRYVQDEAALCPGASATVVGSARGSGLLADPYVLNGGDTVTVAPPTGVTMNSVVFTLVRASDSAPIATTTVSTAPFRFTWADRVDGTLYRLTAVMNMQTDTGVCTDTREFYIADETCSGAGVAQTGSAGGDGLTASTPWQFDGGDTITVTVPSGVTPQGVLFDVVPVSPAGTADTTVTDSTSPYVLTWTDRVTQINTVYRVTITVRYSVGCEETFTRFVRQMPASCRLTVDDPNGTIIRDSGFRTFAVDLTNTSSSTLTLQSIEFDWSRPGGVTWTDVVFPSGGAYAVGATGTGTVTLALNPRPNTLTDADVTIAAGTTKQLTLQFTRGGAADVDDVTAITRICVTYRTADGQVLRCRILNSTAPDASPNNPTSCN